ncbi:MAG TPA: PilC/PilY family type IV pilus protein [Steroidobacteraceae bacterium]
MLYQTLKRLLTGHGPAIGTRVTRAVGLGALLSLAWMATSANANVPLADQPVFAGAEVPGNLALALSVEFPTAISVANLGDYNEDATYLGYFDAHKCYDYVPVQGIIPTDYSASYFQPSAFSSPNHHHCNNHWSGNFMNWATMQTIDPFRWALSGGYRSVDTTSQTILEKAWGSAQGAPSNFPLRGTDQGGGNNLPGQVKKVTPFNWDHFNFMIWQRGNTLVFSSDNGGYADTGQAGMDLTDVGSADPGTVYRVYVRVRVCDSTTSMGIAGLESNCVQYGGHYKPEGLLQQYAEKIRYSALGYLAVNGHDRQGGVIREPMGKIGQTSPRPEWDGATGIMYTNPDPPTASASGVSQSGVMNYLNKFGQASHSYMMYDNVSELYYAAVRYFENLGNVPEWVSGASATELDGFPAVTTWTDPIVYSCQKNFVLGIGDDHTWYDYNVGGSAVGGDRPMPAAVAADTLNKADLWTRNLQTLEGMPLNPFLPYDSGDTDYIAGLAYGVHVNDIRPDLSVNGSKMTISTYWMDVEEYERAEDLNQYYLATKYGGFNAPTAYDINNVTTPLAVPLWDTGSPTPNTINMNGHIRLQPDNYFEAGNAAKMVAGLRLAFSNIANAIKLYSTSFSLGQPIETASGAATYSAQYQSGAWTGTITASTLTFDMLGVPQPPVQAWSSDSTLAAQAAGSGFDTGRNIVTWTPSGAVPFRVGSLTSAQTTALTPSYSTATSPGAFINYLRGDQTNEVGSMAVGSTMSLRSRTILLGDIVNARLTPVPAPQLPYSEASNPGYTAFKTAYASRPTMVYAAANDGMLHGFNGQLTGPNAGMEQFAYIPDGVIQGPNNTPQVNGLAALGNPLFVHHYYVDATPLAFDVDFANAGGVFSASSDWHTILVGGLGKGGNSFYAIDVSDPASMNNEAAVAGKVLWEFSDAHMGFSFGAPIMVKTAKYGWVVVLTSGYNNIDGYGYLFFVNPQTGVLLEKVATPIAAPGLAQATAFIKDYGDYTADSIYAGDLNGNMWRFDLTLPKSSAALYPAPTLLATATDSSSNPQPITSAPLIEIHPTTRQRFVMFGTGQLLSNSDIAISEMQSFYAILDGSAGGFNTVGTPITRSALTFVPDVTIGIVLASPSMGWYTDLGIDTTGNPPDNIPTGYAWRVLVNPVAYNGIVSFTDLLPAGDACSASGHSRVYALNYDTGRSVLNSNVTGYLYYQNAITDLKIIGVNTTGVAGQYVPEIVVGTNTGLLAKVDASLLGTLSTRLLNWREVPTAD